MVGFLDESYDSLLSKSTSCSTDVRHILMEACRVDRGYNDKLLKSIEYKQEGEYTSSAVLWYSFVMLKAQALESQLQYFSCMLTKEDIRVVAERLDANIQVNNQVNKPMKR